MDLRLCRFPLNLTAGDLQWNATREATDGGAIQRSVTTSQQATPCVAPPVTPGCSAFRASCFLVAHVVLQIVGGPPTPQASSTDPPEHAQFGVIQFQERLSLWTDSMICPPERES